MWLHLGRVLRKISSALLCLDNLSLLLLLNILLIGMSLRHGHIRAGRNTRTDRHSDWRTSSDLGRQLGMLRLLGGINTIEDIQVSYLFEVPSNRKIHTQSRLQQHHSHWNAVRVRSNMPENSLNINFQKETRIEIIKATWMRFFPSALVTNG